MRKRFGLTQNDVVRKTRSLLADSESEHPIVKAHAKSDDTESDKLGGSNRIKSVAS